MWNQSRRRHDHPVSFASLSIARMDKSGTCIPGVEARTTVGNIYDSLGFSLHEFPKPLIKHQK
jgi:hypothetical protein